MKRYSNNASAEEAWETCEALFDEYYVKQDSETRKELMKACINFARVVDPPKVVKVAPSKLQLWLMSSPAGVEVDAKI